MLNKTLKNLITALWLLALMACSAVDYDPTKDWTARDYYEDARKSLDAGEFESAIKSLETLEARYPFDPYAKQAQLDVAYSYYKFEEPESALSAIDRFLRLHPRDPHIDYAYYLKGLVNFHRGRGFFEKWMPRDPALHDDEVMQAAFKDFSTLVKRFPQSEYAGDAHQRMIYLRNKMAQKEINIAEFYIKRGTWMAAANRANAVIEQYQESVWRHRALEILVKSYTELGMDDLAADASRVIALNVKPSTPGNQPMDDKLGAPPKVAQR